MLGLDLFLVLQVLYTVSDQKILYRPGDKKICALGLLQLLSLPAEAMPLELQAGMQQVRNTSTLKFSLAYDQCSCPSLERHLLYCRCAWSM